MHNVLRWLRYVFIGAEKPPSLEEAHYPRDASDAPDLTRSLSTLIGILGRERSEAALPLLARVLRDPNSKNGDVDWCSIEAIGDIAGQKFVKERQPKQAAERWLEQRGL